MNDLALVSTFLDAQRAELDASENTQLAYARDLKDFVGWCETRSLGLIDVSQSDIEIGQIMRIKHNALVINLAKADANLV